MLLPDELAQQYRQRTDLIAALRRLATQQMQQAGSLAEQAKLNELQASLLQNELEKVWLPDLEKHLGLSPGDQHYIEQALRVRVVQAPTPAATEGKTDG